MRFFRRSEMKNLSWAKKYIHKFSIGHMLKGWCLEKEGRMKKTPSRNYTDFLNSIHHSDKTLLMFFRVMIAHLLLCKTNTQILQLVPFEMFGTSWHFCIRQLTLARKKCTFSDNSAGIMIHLSLFSLALSVLYHCIDFHIHFFATF